MADAKLTALTAAGALAAADLFYVSQSAASRKATGTQLLDLVGTAYVPLAGGTMTGALTLPNGTAAAPSLVFTGSGATSGFYRDSADQISLAIGGARKLYMTGSGIYATTNLGVYDNNAALIFGTSLDIKLFRDAAATLAQRNGTTQQIFRLYNTYTDASNYERLTLTGVAGTSVNITAETLGTGGDNLDIVLTPAGTGLNKFATGSYFGGSLKVSQSLAGSEDIHITHNAIRMSKWSTLGWNNANTGSSGAFDAGFFREAAGLIAVVTGASSTTYQDLKLRNLLQTAYQEVTEMTAPSAPARDSVRIYAEDNGSGKTRLMALFATGAAQQLAIEP